MQCAGSLNYYYIVIIDKSELEKILYFCACAELCYSFSFWNTFLYSQGCYFFYFLGHISLFSGSLFLFPNCQSKIIYCNAAEVNVGPCTPEMKQDIKVQIKSRLNYKPETNVEISCIGKLYKLHPAL